MTSQDSKTGLLLLYTGSPDSPNPADVGAYLRRFLMDPKVLAMPGWVRFALVHGVIVPLRAGKSAAKYASIWMDAGSPLAVHTLAFQTALEEELPACPIEVGAAYGRPTTADAVNALLRRGAARIVAFPLFPHYAEATQGSLLDMARRALAATSADAPELCAMPPFYEHPAYLTALTSFAAPRLEAFQPDRVVFSYHGLPLRQALAAPGNGGPHNYEEQCRRTTEALTAALGLAEGRFTQAYQSRFGRGWLGPTLEATLEDLAAKGCGRVAVIAPSFLADCLETLEELDLQAKALFLNSGGKAFLRVPALNADLTWVRAAADMIRAL